MHIYGVSPLLFFFFLFKAAEQLFLPTTGDGMVADGSVGSDPATGSDGYMFFLCLIRECNFSRLCWDFPCWVRVWTEFMELTWEWCGVDIQLCLFVLM